MSPVFAFDMSVVVAVIFARASEENGFFTIEKIIKYLKKNNKSITVTYTDWFRVALAIANSFTHEVGQKYYLQLCELDGDNYDEYKSKYLLDYCYANRKLGKIGFPTIVYLAKQAGFK